MTGEEIKIRRKELGLTQFQLAVKLGVTPTTVARWEQGQRKMAWRQQQHQWILPELQRVLGWPEGDKT